MNVLFRFYLTMSLDKLPLKAAEARGLLNSESATQPSAGGVLPDNALGLDPQ